MLSFEPRLLYAICYFAEYAITKTVSRGLEPALKTLQMRKIQRGKFIADDNALVFHHPRPQNQEALYLYEQNLKQLRLS